MQSCCFSTVHRLKVSISLWCHVSLLVLSLLIKGSRFNRFTTCWDIIFMLRWWDLHLRGLEVCEQIKANSISNEMTGYHQQPCVRVSARDKKNLIVVEWKMLSSDGFCVPFSLSCQTIREPGCDGRVVKALDLKSNGVSPRRFKSCSQRWSSASSVISLFLCWI